MATAVHAAGVFQSAMKILRQPLGVRGYVRALANSHQTQSCPDFLVSAQIEGGGCQG